MNQTLIDNWNATVKKGDRVLHLGDVAWDFDEFNKIRPILNGSIDLILGNHDPVKYLAGKGWFRRLYVIREFKELGAIFSHVPVNIKGWNEHRWQAVNVHGHTHEQKVEGPYINLSVEQTSFAPMRWDEVVSKIREKKKEFYT